MALPINEVPKYSFKLPSNGQLVKYRPFLVKEEKVMLMALESDNDEEINQAIVDTVQSCVFDKIDVSKLPIFDFEALYLKIRGKSVGEVIKLKLKCPDDEKQVVDYELNLEDVKVDMTNKPDNKIEFEQGYGVILEYPTIKSYTNTKSETENNLSLLKDSIKTIYKGEDVYDRNNITEEEIDEYVNSLTQKQYKQLMEFFKNMPKISHKIEYENPKSGKKFALRFNGASDFFLITLSHENLENFYRVNFLLMQHHKYSLTELEHMLPWEREIYIDMLIQHIKDENQKLKERQRR